MATSKGKTGWGGKWTEEKLNAFEKYVKAYLKVMKTNRDKYQWKLIYFDAFAGSGVQGNEKPEKQQQRLAGVEIEPEETDVYKGAAERVLAIKQAGFDYYYFIDSSQAASDTLRQKLEKTITNPKLVFRVGDANEQIKKLGNLLQKDKSYKALVLLDPFGMQVDWGALTHLQETGTDLWILLPSGVAINRLLQTDGTLMHPEQLTRYFGLSEKKILSLFYAEKTEKTFFGNETTLSKIEQPIGRIASIYVQRLETIFSYVTKKPLVMYNNNGAPIYHFVFASNNPTAEKIANDIIRKDS